MWVMKAALREAIDARSPSSCVAMARIGNRRLGPYELLCRRQGKFDFLLLRAATAAAAAGLPPTPDAAMLDAANSSDESEVEEERPPKAAAAARHAAAARQQQGSAAAAPAAVSPLPTAHTSSVPKVPPAITAMLSTLPPAGPGDATPEERRALLATAMLASALPVAAQLPVSSAWVLGAYTSSTEIKTVRNAILLLRVRRVSQPGAPATAPAGCMSALDRCAR